MKLYFNLLSFAWGLFCFMPLAQADTFSPISQEAAAETEIVETSAESGEGVSKEGENTSETIAEDPAQRELEAAFPGCEVTASDVPVVVVATKDSQLDASEDIQQISNLDLATATNQADIQSTASKDKSNSSENSNPEAETVAEKDDQDSVKAESESEANELNKELEPQCPTPDELARYQQLAKADQLYLAGDKEAAIKIYQEQKEDWDLEVVELDAAIYEVEQLSPGGKVYWRNYREGKAQNLTSKIFTPLKLIVSKDPSFIPGHIAYAEQLMATEKTAEAHAVMERAIGLYPQEVPLLKAKIAQDVATERWLEASIAARQFALFNPEHEEATEFTQLADDYLKAYQDKVEEELTWNAIGNAITGAAGFALTGNLYGPISAIETTVLLLQGEAKLGDRFANRAAKKLPMVEDEAILNYVQEIGDKIAAVAGRDEFEYEFFVIMDENLNAFALPGGKIFVNLGAILNTDSEAELAGLLAHEVAHSVLSHGFQLVTRGSLTANVAQYIPYVGSTASNLIVMNYSRDMERQADVFGTRILVAADYSADGVKNLMEQLEHIHAEDEDHQEPPAWLSTHPLTNQRVAYIKELIITNNLNRYAYEGVENHQMIKNKARQAWHEYQLEKQQENAPEKEQ